MPAVSDFVSPKQAARALGVSESSLKRWCDRGLLNISRTAGGHRQLPVSEVLRFARAHQHPLPAPEVLGLPAVAPQSQLALTRAVALLAESLLAGNEAQTHQIIFDLHLAGHRFSIIADNVIAAAFHEIGDRWECRQAEVYQERRACAIMSRALFELRRLQSASRLSSTAIGGTLEGDRYELPSLMAELVLRENGWQATALGVGIPVASLIAAIDQTRPMLVWISASHISDAGQFIQEMNQLQQACSQYGTALVVGGRALVQELRQKISYSAFCDTMQHLESFAATRQQSRDQVLPK